ncbi:hypothetical protein OROHE_013617 [Orobanche hederae]
MGIGYEILVEMLRYMSATHVVKLQRSAQSRNLPDGAFWLCLGCVYIGIKPHEFTLWNMYFIDWFLYAHGGSHEQEFEFSFLNVMYKATKVVVLTRK